MADWGPTSATWPGPIDREQEKRDVARQLVERAQDGDVVGAGSGSTSFLAVLELGRVVAERGIAVVAVPTSYEVARACTANGLRVASLRDLRPDWAFDGADEVDPAGRVIKGRGGAMLRERLVFAAAAERHLLVDSSKLVERLGQRFAVPLEVVPEAVSLVERFVRRDLEVRSAELRTSGGGKDGPVVTEHGNLVLDVAIEGIDDATEDTLGRIPGVVATGLFTGFDYQLHVAGR
ncbi:MAG: ribose 5-phosphate isomerase A [Acidimicrobiia bacterium]|nr:ribose 5-phosphate isomerase A [Acidimicrobiia bacterium]